jgi:cyclopropane-fatty-acyl-phospholipid synthase
MTVRLDTASRTTTTTTTLGDIFARLFGADAPVRFSAYDGSTGGDPNAAIGLRLLNPRGLAYLVTAPGSLGMARAYVNGDLEIGGVHHGDPYEVLRVFADDSHARRPEPAEALRWLRAVGLTALVPPKPPEEEVVPTRRWMRGIRHSKARDATAISHHYDVSNRFYEMVLGPTMAYTCACYPTEDATLEEAQDHKHDLIARKLGLRPGMRLLDVGCGYGGMVRHAAKHYGVRALGVTLSKQQAEWGAERIRADGLSAIAEVRHLDYRDVEESEFDAISAIGLIEHVGIANYPTYFQFLRSRLRVGGRLLNHGITRSNNRHPGWVPRGFINRYVFPDGELTGSGTIVMAMENAGLEVQHQENLRSHYARTLQAWCANLVAHWDEAVAEARLGTAKVWGLYMAGCRLGFERNNIQLHQILATRTDGKGGSGYPLRPDFGV